MGSYAYLDSFDGRVLSANSPQLEAKYYVPIFWLALFEPSDLRYDRVAEARFPNIATVFAIEPPYLLARTPDAQARFDRRMPALAKLADTHAALVAKFAAFIATVEPTIMVRFAGLSEMMEPGKFENQVRGALELVQALDTRDADPARYLVAPLTHVWSGADWKQSMYAEAVLSGWNWQP
jgi:hypothetical protein